MILQNGESAIWSSVQDISDRKQAETKLHLANEELVRATRLKDEFLANMSHELRTPLNAILGMTEGLQEEVFGIVNDRQLKALRTVEKSASHLLSLINDILDVAKIESGQITLDYNKVSVKQLCASSLSFVKQQALKKNIQLHTEIPANIELISVDEVRIRQVLINLLTNAVKFTPERGTVTLTVSLLLQENTSLNYLRIAIRDTGIGISPENAAKLFKPFVQIDGALNRQQTGTGLGLVLVKQIVELHGGKVGLTSELGVSSCFTIDLPCSHAPGINLSSQVGSLPLDQESTPPLALANAPMSDQPPLVLLAEDNPANVATISSYLQAKGYRILVANNGWKAVELSISHQPDVILMDIQMPDLDGLEAMGQIRQQSSLQDTPIVALTALAMKGDQERCLAAGADYYLSKPVKLKQLDNLLKEILAHRRSAN
jgi:CheY-like chemotaxis protein/nitrogen-specific signal transduction histidine kinase